MITLDGKYNSAKVFTDNVDKETISQIIELLNQDFTVGSKIRIMPDTHAGKGCVIGFTADVQEKVVPNLVGVDIDCGMLVINLGKEIIDYDMFDKLVYKVPHGHSVNPKPVLEISDLLAQLNCKNILIDIPRIKCGIGSLGGGNHFIELNRDKDSNIYLVIHSGSRNLGKQVCDIYQKTAIQNLSMEERREKIRKQIIVQLKNSGKTHLIASTLKNFDNTHDDSKSYPKTLCYLEGSVMQDYLHDVLICQEYAKLNRWMMAKFIVENYFGVGMELFEYFETVHNYIEKTPNNTYIIRKGAVRANEGEKFIVPINMRDGSLICIGKGNADWNLSAPHGAGRIMSRSQANKELNLDDFKNMMKNVFTTSVSLKTIDESPMAYKSMDEIIENTSDTMEVVDIIKPIYNFKAGV